MTFDTRSPAEARELLEQDAGWAYLDVRSVPEFEQGHPEASFNIPFLELHPAGQMMPNPRFVEVVKKHFPPGSKLVLGCAAGVRSARACELLAAQGFTALVSMNGGFSGARDMAGRVTQAGWASCGYPVSKQALPGRSYVELSA